MHEHSKRIRTQVESRTRTHYILHRLHLLGVFVGQVGSSLFKVLLRTDKVGVQLVVLLCPARNPSSGNGVLPLSGELPRSKELELCAH